MFNLKKKKLRIFLKQSDKIIRNISFPELLF